MILKIREMPTDFKFPFIADNISSIVVASMGIDKIDSFYGVIEFTNGNTTGKQRFYGNTFDDVVFKMKAFADEMISDKSKMKIV